MSSTFWNRRRSRLIAVLATAVASVAIAAGAHALPSSHGAQTARSSWSSAPDEATASLDFTVQTYRSSWS
jgi:hypothetical protein